MVIEPGTPKGFSLIRGIRDELLASGRLGPLALWLFVLLAFSSAQAFKIDRLVTSADRMETLMAVLPVVSLCLVAFGWVMLPFLVAVVWAAKQLWPEQTGEGSRCSAVRFPKSNQGSSANEGFRSFAQARARIERQEEVIDEAGLPMPPAGGGTHTIYQDVIIPADSKSALLSWADRIRNQGRLATMAVGNISSYQDVNTILAAGRADLCVLARAHLWDPYWTRHAAYEQGYALPWPDLQGSRL